MKTILELAVEIGQPKQRLYRCIKRYALNVHQDAGVMYLDEVAESKLISLLLKDDPHQRSTSEASRTASDNAALIRLYERENELLREQLKAKDEQYNRENELLREQLKAKDEQIKGLQLMLLQKQLPFWRRLFLPAGKA